MKCSKLIRAADISQKNKHLHKYKGKKTKWKGKKSHKKTFVQNKKEEFFREI